MYHRSPQFLTAILVVSAFALATSCEAQMVSGAKMPEYANVFGLNPADRAKLWAVSQTGSSLGTNVLHPGEKIQITLRLANAGAQPLEGGFIDLIPYGTSVPAGDVWTPTVLATPGQPKQQVPLNAAVPVKGTQTLTLDIPVPERFGSYALVADFGPRGRAKIGSLSRTVAPDVGPVAFPSCSLDMPKHVSPSSMGLLRKIGIKATRMELGPFDPTGPDAAKRWADLDARFKLMRENDVTVMLTIGAGTLPQPLGAPRPHLDADGRQLDTKADNAWLPAYDPKFKEWVKTIATRWGYPKGPVNAMELWNEPWEGISISGWGADMPRYREIYKTMAEGVLEARRESNVQILLGGASSSSNTLDKLFPDGSNEFLPILDFASIHYQTMAAAPALVKTLLNRQPTPVQTWDTETWVANSEDRVAVVIASMRAMGQQRVLGIYHGNAFETERVRADGKEYDVTQALNITPAVAAVTKFIGNRNFGGLVFQNGLPWVFTFEGAPEGAEAPAKNIDNGTLVVVGDLSGAYDEKQLLFRDVLGVKNEPLMVEAEKKFASLPPTLTARERRLAEAERLRSRILTGASLTIPDGGGNFRAFDFVGNPIPSKAGKITVPLDALGYYLRTDGSPGSFAALKSAVKSGRIDGIEPLSIQALDFTAPIAQKPELRLRLTNILNRPLSGALTLESAGLTFGAIPNRVPLGPNETKIVSIPVADGKNRPDNTYEVKLKFDAGADGSSQHTEKLHCNVIARKAITLDGDLRDWEGALPQPAGGKGLGVNLTEQAWLPFMTFNERAAGLSNGYLAYDADNFYFAAKIGDVSPDEGTLNFAQRDDEQFYYPPVAYKVDRENSLAKKDVEVGPSTEPRVLEKPGGFGRSMAYYETGASKAFEVHLNVPANKSFQVALYFVDPDPIFRRNQRIQMLAPDGKVLDTREIRQFGPGRYVVYSVHGPVRFRISTLNVFTAVLSGIFLDATTETTSKFLQEDATTGGEWAKTYGKAGHHLAALNFSKLPEGVTIATPEQIKQEELKWPEGVRRYSYRRRPFLPFNTGDDVQIAFNVLPDAEKPWTMNPPGVPPKWMLYPDTDYEYSLYRIADRFGGGNQVWRLSVPGMPRKHFYPRQPKWHGNEVHQEGAVQNAKLIMKRDGATRIVELALPWSEMPHVKAALDAGRPVKFSYRVSDNLGQPYELAQDRSVSKANFYTFHPDFNTHWANELEFGWEK